MIDKPSDRLLKKGEIDENLEAFYAQLIDFQDCSFDDLDFQFRYLGMEVENFQALFLQNEFEFEDIAILGGDSFVRGLIMYEVFNRHGREAIRKLIERQALPITEHDILMYQERRELDQESVDELRKGIKCTLIK